ncbi:hypothetical protein IPC1138_07980 [Pseudomonas aeruginosa]|uniref:hypothetical protein n=1 Tax=Pseudomonas aeruginosa TaxID=287 RepID=UPI000FC42EDE|nr:hypothetical protein [Pseudomonas aeruginosa]RPP70246.1 hypothetical protein IPC1138_07980 [Pseudomonas aeruginosa]RUF28651.1 hypothetical protein IPC1111_00010 [Pseudomonas aeruginosa]HBP6214873.1 hypothetical protein [Pseudomonas aeruginosa]
MLIRHLSHGEDFRLNRCPGSVDHYNRVISREDLRRENEENIQAHLGEIKKEISKAVADDLRKRLQNAFKGSKGFKLK